MSKLGSPIPMIRQVLAHAASAGLPPIADGDVDAGRRPLREELRLVMFPQVWSSTALGFGGIGGAAMTEAYTMIVQSPDESVAVYFDGQHAYTIQRPSDALMEDIGKQQLAYCRDAHGRYETARPATPAQPAKQRTTMRR